MKIKVFENFYFFIVTRKVGHSLNTYAILLAVKTRGYNSYRIVTCDLQRLRKFYFNYKGDDMLVLFLKSLMMILPLVLVVALGN